ncbi:VanZ family protein [Thermaerobacter marianensis DSM 12885]|uniref:VanZ family protein n=1 Tax=Thermaerobacter marianensis (strain ATCC 700841 / DSM 12885 / JCM 10246 / 7p75a) TaxID=644966 RepID=E6SH02_THEM7|nr:VanZ family protein [Thermaerobacter marianensis]ADU50633.1 VanZ family protein [Thermaerobacter marianensis DSM 12885]
MDRSRTWLRQGSAWLQAAVALLYVGVLLRVTVLKFPQLLMNQDWQPQSLMLQWRFAVNPVPFRTIAGYLAGEPSAGIAVQNLAGNVLIFVPWGVLWVWCRAHRARAAVVVGTALVASFVLEVAEFLLRVGSFDVDDLLLNGLGAFLGYGAARFPWRRRFRARTTGC